MASAKSEECSSNSEQIQENVMTSLEFFKNYTWYQYDRFKILLIMYISINDIAFENLYVLVSI